MPSFLHRIGLRKRWVGKDKPGKTTSYSNPAPNPETDSPTAKEAPDARSASVRRHSFDSRASGSIISIPRSTNTIDDFDDLKPWKRRKNKGKNTNRGNVENITEQMRRDLVALQHKIDRIEAHVVPKASPSDSFTIEDNNGTLTTNGLRTFLECARTIYEEGKDPRTESDSVPETPEDIRNAFINSLEQCKDPKFFFKLSRKILEKYGDTYGSNTQYSGASSGQDLPTDALSQPSSQLKLNKDVPRIEYGPRHETAETERIPKPFEAPLTSEIQLTLASNLEPKPVISPQKAIPVDRILLQVNATKRQRGELMPHIQVPFGPSPPTVSQRNKSSQEPKYIGMHEFYAENCIEKLTERADQMAELPRPYTENMALESTGARPQIEATVSRPNALSKPAVPSFKSSIADLSIEDTTVESLPASKPVLTSPYSPTSQKLAGTLAEPLIISDNPVAYPMRFDDSNFNENSSRDEESSPSKDISIDLHGQGPEQISQAVSSETQLEGLQIRRLDINDVQIGEDTCRADTTGECRYSCCLDDCESSEDDEEKGDTDDDEAAAHLSAIHLLILFKVLAKREKEYRGSNQTDQSEPSDSSEGSESSNHSGGPAQNPNTSNIEGNRPGGASRKRNRENGQDNDGDDPNGSPPKRQALDVMRDILRRFACPLARGDPQQHVGCQMISRQNLSGLKEHVKRKHFGNVLPHGIRVARSWNEVFLYCNQGWTKPIPSPYISDMFLIANDGQPLSFEPSPSHGSYRSIVPSPPHPILREMAPDTNGSGVLSQRMVQIHDPHLENLGVGYKEPTVGQEMIDFLATDEFSSLLDILPPHLRNLNYGEFESSDVENYMQSNLGINVNQARSQLMTPEFANNLNMLFQQPEEAHYHQQQEAAPPNQSQISSPPALTLQLKVPSDDNWISEPPSASETASEKSVGFVSAELSHGLDYLFKDAKPYIRAKRPESRLSASSSSSSLLPSSCSSSVLVVDTGTLTPDTLLSERELLEPASSPKGGNQPKPSPQHRKKKYTLRIRQKPPGPKQYSTFSFNDDNEYQELKQDFGTWMNQGFFLDNEIKFSWDAWELENPSDKERISNMEELVQALQFTWTAFRTSEAAFFLVPKQ